MKVCKVDDRWKWYRYSSLGGSCSSVVGGCWGKTPTYPDKSGEQPPQGEEFYFQTLRTSLTFLLKMEWI